MERRNPVRRTRQQLICLWFLVGVCSAAFAGSMPRLRSPLHRDADDKSIQRPKTPDDPSELFAILHNSWFRHLNPETVVRGAADPGALNVNAWDEVPDSTWITNRIGRAHLPLKEILGGLPGAPPASPPWKVVRVRDEGYTPKIEITDSQGARYVLKFDLPANPERNSGAERICTLIMYAAGYNVPLNTIVHFRPEDLKLDKDSYYRDALKKRRPLTPADMVRMLGKLKPGADGSYRGLASLFLSGDLLGPFMYTGTRKDDPNDIIPHELRRELRGMRVIASWINHTDTKDVNAMDVFIKDPKGRTYVRHYLLDFGSTMGSGDFINGPFRIGHEYIYDGSAMARSFLTLGIWRRPWDVHGKVAFPEVGYFGADLFDPAGWKPNYPNLAFERTDDADSYWGAKIVTAYPNELIAGMVAEGAYSRAEVSRYVIDVLQRRRDAIGLYWLNRVTALEDFSLEGDTRLKFRDLAVERGYAERPSRSYRAVIRDYSGTKLTAEVVTAKGAEDLELPRQAVRAARADVTDRYGRTPVLRLTIASSRRDGRWALPVEVILGRTRDSSSLTPLGWTHAPE